MIDPGDRGFAVGMTGTGKSRLLGYYFATYPGQRVLVDVNDDYELGSAAVEEGACIAREPAAIDWSARTIRYVPSQLDQDEYEQLYTALWRRVAGGRPLLVWLDESEGPTSSQQAPKHLRIALGQGRKKDLTHLAASLRPVEVYRKIVNQSEHCFAFPTTDEDDIQMLARRFGVSPAEFAGALHSLEPYGFLYHRLGVAEIKAFSPLDEQRLALTARHVRMP